MNTPSYIIASEYVSAGHPDKIADCISDSILDLYLSVDPDAKVACETMVKNNTIYLVGEISTSAPHILKNTIPATIKQLLIDIGYNSSNLGFDANTVNIVSNISSQSDEIHTAVAGQGEAQLTAGDQGIMFGFATRETPTFMPIPIYVSKLLIDVANDYIRGSDAASYNDTLRPDMKSQVAVQVNKPTGEVESIDSIVFSSCHAESVSHAQLVDIFHTKIIPRVIELLPSNLRYLFDSAQSSINYFINPAGAWHLGGPVADSGLTGRKIVVDQYGADCEIGGGAFSGKDSSKVDRSAAYMARHIALHVLHTNPAANKIKVQLAYAIGVMHPVSYRIWDPTTNIEYGLGKFTLEDLTPSAIIDRFQLRSPIYTNTARFGHFGNTSNAWERNYE